MILDGDLKPDKFLENIFPEHKFLSNGSTVYIKSNYLESYSPFYLQQFGYNKIYNGDEKRNLYSRKRPLEEFLFDKRDFISASRMKNYLDEKFKAVIKEVEPDIIKSVPMERAFGDKGNKFEQYCLDYLENKLLKIDKSFKIKRLCEKIPDLNDYKMIKETYLSIERGEPILYQPLLLDTKMKIYGCPDFLIRSDIFLKLFSNNRLDVENLLTLKNNFGNNYYLVVDVKILTSRLLGNGFLCKEKKMELNKFQVYFYNRILSGIQGNLPYPYNLGFIMSPKLLFNFKSYSGLDYLGKFRYNDKYEQYFLNSLDGIKYIRKINNVKKLLKNPDNKPPRKKSNSYYKVKDSYYNARRKYGYYSSPRFRVNENNCKRVSNILIKCNLVFVDFEAINLLLNLSPDEYQLRLDEGNNQVCQIGIIYNKNGKIIYKSFFADSYSREGIKKIFVDFLSLLKVLNGASEKPLGIVSWGNFESSCYNELKKRYNFPKLNIIDLYSMIRKADIFPEEVSLSLKNLLPNLHKKYPKFFPNTYKNLSISNGEVASVELFKYYYSVGSEKSKIRDDIEKYNYIDCLVLKQMVDWVNNNKINL